ncbi:MAG: hypothetical protein HUU60_10270 [Armatimonadetes bacterium]|nr:hypothetical protein [Armatimonadota bacterium]
MRFNNVYNSVWPNEGRSRRLTNGWTLAIGDQNLQVSVPFVWEDLGVDKRIEGPAKLDLTFDARPMPGRRYWLKFDGANYYLSTCLNGVELGSHEGIWDDFAFEITDAIKEHNVLEVEVIKNGGPTYPVPDVLSGFLPYVSTTFGGLWRDVWLIETGQAVIKDLFIRKNRKVEAQGDFDELIVETSEPTEWPNMRSIEVKALKNGEVGHIATYPLAVSDAKPKGARLSLNGKEFIFRGILHWGWTAKSAGPERDPKAFENKLLAIKASGYNGVKFCLWAPPNELFDVCDRLGMLVWMELPLWQIRIADEERVLQECARIVRRLRRHPSIVLWTLGCEMRDMPKGFLKRLYRLVRQMTGSRLIASNSGGAEAYHGRLDEPADFYDYHLYGDLHHQPQLFSSFGIGLRKPKPWLQGEFNDCEVYRSIGDAWWSSKDEAVNPVGIRWLHNAPYQNERIEAVGLSGLEEQMRQSSERQSRFMYQTAIQRIRSLPQLAGYVTTSIEDTPIAANGFLDDEGRPRLASACNQELALLLDTERAREWIAGGDRPIEVNPHTAFASSQRLIAIGASNGGADLLRGELTVEVIGAEDGNARKVKKVSIKPGVSHLTEMVVAWPNKEGVAQVLASFQSNDLSVSDQWLVSIFERDLPSDFALYDPESALGFLAHNAENSRTLVATRWDERIVRHLKEGGSALYVQSGATGLPADHLPFWRECFRLTPEGVSESVAIDDSNQGAYLDVSTDRAFIPDRCAQKLETKLSPILMRVDARTYALHYYVFEANVGKGCLIATTLALGNTPFGRSLLRKFVARIALR